MSANTAGLFTECETHERIHEGSRALTAARQRAANNDVFACGDHDGERLAIAEFNASHTSRKISAIHGLRYFVPRRFSDRACWAKYYMAYVFDHPLYDHNERLVKRALDLLPVESASFVRLRATAGKADLADEIRSIE